ncbi:MAG: tripartite tricarboxylate transporter substrate binding protein, partial [Betaproteobacteria bacterium]|nr:tripartite tricarboxylate transporter substrate binding protein [Betaproteobacteria bacterium]
GANIIIDNRPGAGGGIGAELAKHATPDGHTLLMISSSNVIHPILYEASYDVQRDFFPVAQLVTQPYMLAVTLALPVKSVAELISYAKSHPDELTFGSAGSGSMTHLAAELFKQQAQVKAVHVPYKGMGAAYPDLIAGRIQASAPTVPTVAEAGLPRYIVTQWYGAVAPAQTPSAIVNKLNGAIVRVFEDPELGKYLANDGAEASVSAPREFLAHLKSEHARWSGVIDKSGLRKIK